jgi:hypothetical protein
MAEITRSEAEVIAKEIYGNDGVGNCAYEDNPWFGMMEKKRFRGKFFDFPVKHSYTSNGSRTGSTALAKANGDYPAVEFNVPTVADFDAISIEKKALNEIRDEGAFVELMKDAIDGLIKSLSNTAGSDAFGHRGAAIGQVASIPTATTLQLTNPSDVVHFEINMEIASSEANGLSGALQAGTATVTAIDRDNGILTTDGGGWVAQIATLDADDFLFRSGDFGLGRAGLADWVPDVTTGLSTAFYAATRSVDAVRLAGSRLTGGSLTPTQAIRQLAAQMGREGGNPDLVLVSHLTFNDIVSELHNKMEYVRTGSSGMDATVGFDGITIVAGRGKMTVHSDRSCPDDHLYLVKKDTWKCIHSQSAPVKIDDEDGNILSRESSSFAYDVRGASFLNFVCKAPVHQGVVVY